jgi:hypothetical protein
LIWSYGKIHKGNDNFIIWSPGIETVLLRPSFTNKKGYSPFKERARVRERIKKRANLRRKAGHLPKQRRTRRPSKPCQNLSKRQLSFRAVVGVPLHSTPNSLGDLESFDYIKIRYI